MPNQFYALLVGRVDENEVDRRRKNDTEMLDQAFQILVFLKSSFVMLMVVPSKDIK